VLRISRDRARVTFFPTIFIFLNLFLPAGISTTEKIIKNKYFIVSLTF
jgi:hypothetical protein